MLFYQVQVTSQQIITSLPFYTQDLTDFYSKEHPVKALNDYMEDPLDNYANKYNGYHLKPIIHSIEDQKFTLLAYCKYEINRGHDLADYIKKAFFM